MTTAIATTDARLFSPEQVRILKETIAKDATEPELQFFAMVCNKTGLDPFTKQIHFVKRKGKVAFQTGIDGYRTTAHKTGEHAGTDDVVYEGEGLLATVVNGKKADIAHPIKASVTVYRIVKGLMCKFSASARWAEYYPGAGDEGFMWRKMPFGQLGKCAEALALRKAFSSELAGVYVQEEMEQAGSPSSHAHVETTKVEAPEVKQSITKPEAQNVINDAQRKKFWATCKAAKLDESVLRKIVKDIRGDESTAGMTDAEMDSILDAVKVAAKMVEKKA